MARALKAKKPDDVEAGKPKVIVFGPPGVGKTWETLNFPRVYFIDVEDGASLPHYLKKLRAADGAYMGVEDGSQDFGTVIEELKTLATVEHDYLTLVVDSFSKLYNLAASQAELKIGNEFGKDKKEANKPTRQLMYWLGKLDMNVILICHQKDAWKRDGAALVNTGATFDAWDKLAYDLHLVLEVQKGKSFPNTAVVHKSRLEGFPNYGTMPWSYTEFAKRAGVETMLKTAKAFKVADAVQVAEVKRLIALLKVSDEWVEKCFAKAGTTDWAEMDAEKITKVIGKLNDDIKGKSNGAAD